VKKLSDNVIRSTFNVYNQNKYQISAHWLKIKSHKNAPGYSLHINRISNTSLLISQYSNHVSPCKLGLMQTNEWEKWAGR